MSFLKIKPGVGALADTGQFIPHEKHELSEENRNKIFERDDYSCRYCGFKADKYQQVQYTGTGKETEENLDNYATACVFCHQCFHLDQVAVMQSGAIIWMPEIGQAALHHICRAIYVARITQGPIADAAREALDILLGRKEEARHRLGTDDPRIISSILQDFLEGREYKYREKRLEGFKILPLDRRIIHEGDLEFNQFPQILAYWRSKKGPFGAIPPRKWTKIFYDFQDGMNK